MKVVKNKNLKKLPRGEGSMYYLNDATLEYKKTIVFVDSSYGFTYNDAKRIKRKWRKLI